MNHKRRVGILTGGGDVPGLNSVIKTVVYRCAEQEGDYSVIGIRRGWEGLTHLNLNGGADAGYVVPLDRNNTRTIDRTGGTCLHTSRTNPAKMDPEGLPEHVQAQLGRCREFRELDKKGNEHTYYDLTPVVRENLERLQLDYLIAIGGDDTLSYAAKLHADGFPVVAVPKTMDNDVRNTEYCIGFSTAMTRAVESISRLRTTVGSHERFGVLRIFGRDAGFTALYAAYVTSLRCCIPEFKFDLQTLIELLVQDKRDNPSHYAMVLLSEGAAWQGYKVKEYGDPDAYGHYKKMSVAEALAQEIENQHRQATLVADLTYELRGGEADFFDKLASNSFATMACQCLFDGEFGRMTAIRDGRFTVTDIPDPARGPRRVEVQTMYDIERLRPRYNSMRGRPVFLMPANPDEPADT
jgi:6-phosphofructokinase